MEAGVARVHGSRCGLPTRSGVPEHAGAQVTLQSARLGLLADGDPGAGLPDTGALLRRLLRIAQLRLAEQHDNGEFVFTVTGEPQRRAARGGCSGPGTSLRYGAITALGLLRLPEPDQRTVLAGMTAEDLVGQLAKGIDEISGLGDAALVCWAAAECGHADTDARAPPPRRAGPGRSAPWTWCRRRGWSRRWSRPARWPTWSGTWRRRGSACSPRAARRSTRTPPARARPWYRAHVGSFADQVYPIQALARLHGSADDPEALAVAGTVARAICSAQGAGRPVVVALRLADRRGRGGLPGVQRAPARDGADGAARPGRRGRGRSPGRDPARPALAGRAARGPPWSWSSTSRRSPGARWRGPISGRWCAGCGRHPPGSCPGARVAALDRVYPPGEVDHECRPYELGWLLYTWLS